MIAPVAPLLPIGEDFLAHFDMLIDNGHELLCLDDSGSMRAEVKGPHMTPVPAVSGNRNSLIWTQYFPVRFEPWGWLTVREPAHNQLYVTFKRQISRPNSRVFPVNFPVSREFGPETSSHETRPAMEPLIVAFLRVRVGSPFNRSKAIRQRMPGLVKHDVVRARYGHHNHESVPLILNFAAELRSFAFQFSDRV